MKFGIADIESLHAGGSCWGLRTFGEVYKLMFPFADICSGSRYASKYNMYSIRKRLIHYLLGILCLCISEEVHSICYLHCTA